MVFNEKLTKNRKLRGLKLRGLRRHQINTPNFKYENVQRKLQQKLQKKMSSVNYYTTPVIQHPLKFKCQVQMLKFKSEVQF